jgi:hypothetical protein
MARSGPLDQKEAAQIRRKGGRWGTDTGTVSKHGGCHGQPRLTSPAIAKTALEAMDWHGNSTGRNNGRRRSHLGLFRGPARVQWRLASDRDKQMRGGGFNGFVSPMRSSAAYLRQWRRSGQELPRRLVELRLGVIETTTANTARARRRREGGKTRAVGGLGHK